MSMRLTETLALLSRARAFVTEGERYVTEQKAFVKSLERRGRDTSSALEYLEALEGMQAEYVDLMVRLERQVLRLIKPQDDDLESEIRSSEFER
jgi:hypothetical protein